MLRRSVLVACLMIVSVPATSGLSLESLGALDLGSFAAPALPIDGKLDTIADLPPASGPDEGGEETPDGTEPTSNGEAIVGFMPGFMPLLSPDDDYYGHRVVKVSLLNTFFVVVADDLAQLRRDLQYEWRVLYVEDNGWMTTSVIPNDTRYGEQYGPGMMGFPAAWSSTAGYGSSSIKVGIIDTGVRKTHEDLTGGRMLQGYDQVNGDSDPDDECGHGTHVTGTIAASTNNGKGVAGMSQASIIMEKALSAGLPTQPCSGSIADISDGIAHATSQGARVISMSIGSSSSSTTLQNSINNAWNAGVVLVAAAGNGGSTNGVDYPGAYPNVLAVAALTSAKVRASYSDQGPQVDVAAPGSGILSTGYSSNTNYVSMDGTSMATPHVAGAIALALSCNPSATNTQVVAAVTSSVEDLGAAGFDNSYGYGLLRADFLVNALCGGGPPGNVAPTACFSHSETGLQTDVNGGCSTDSDGTIASYSWNWGDGTPNGSGATASHTYATAGTRTVVLTVTDNVGGTGITSQSVTVSGGFDCTTDPDTSTANLASGTTKTATVPSGGNVYYKICVPAGKSQLKVDITPVACGKKDAQCAILDADLYTRLSARPTDTVYDCRPFATGSTETCTHANPAAGWWYVRVNAYQGSGKVNIKATYS